MASSGGWHWGSFLFEAIVGWVYRSVTLDTVLHIQYTGKILQVKFTGTSEPVTTYTGVKFLKCTGVGRLDGVEVQ